jgi:hypothetical protein
VLLTGRMTASTRLDKEMLCAMTEENGSGNDEETATSDRFLHRFRKSRNMDSDVWIGVGEVGTGVLNTSLPPCFPSFLYRTATNLASVLRLAGARVSGSWRASGRSRSLGVQWV